MCLAVDPDLLVTVNAMTGGYVVNDAPDAGPGTPTHPGAGQDAAVGWLNRLKALAQRMCVAPTTYAQADLDALQRVGDPGLSVDRHQRRRRHRRPDPRRRVDPRRHPGRRRPADRARASSCCRRRARRSRSAPRPSRHRRSDSDDRRAGDRRRPAACGTRRKWSPRRSTRPSVPRWQARAPTLVAVVSGSVAGHPGQTRFRRSPAARTRWARCCGAACTPTPSRAARS